MAEVNNSEAWTPERIKTLRERLNLTQKQAGNTVGVNDSMWCHWEKGRHAPTRPFQILLALLEQGVLDVPKASG